MNIGIFLEIDNNRVLPVGLELIGKTLEIMGNRSYEIYGVIVISNCDDEESVFASLKELRKYLDEIFIYEYEDEFLTTEHYKEALCDYVNNYKSEILLIGATPLGRSFAPRIAAYFKTGITADCTELRYDERYGLIQTRPAFGEEILAEIITSKTFPQMATVRPGIMNSPIKEGKKSPDINIKKIKLSKKNITILERNRRKQKEVKLNKAKIVVVAGNGIKEKEDLFLAQKVAKSLGGELGVTRPLVEGGLAPYSRQVGVSGNILSASIVLLFGVSGSNQTLTGIRKVKRIVAVNNDPDASIFGKVDLGIVDDWKNVAMSILNRIGGY